jgi:hypothetical protein
MPFKEPASLHDWHGGPPIIPAILSGNSDDGISRISPSIRLVSEKLARKVGQMIGNAVPVNLAYHVAMQIKKTLVEKGIIVDLK